MRIYLAKLDEPVRKVYFISTLLTKFNKKPADRITLMFAKV